jgi:hypothetical protein
MFAKCLILTRLIGKINGGESLYELRRLFVIESSLSFVGVSRIIFVVVVFFLDLAPNTGCVINAKWWLGTKLSPPFVRGDVNIKSFVFSLPDVGLII